jgi:hypothetical protein
MKRIVVNEKQKKNLLEISDLDDFNPTLNNEVVPSEDPEEEEKRLEALSSFLNIIIRRLEEVSSNLLEVKEFIETDPYAKENIEKFKPFFDDINNLINSVDHIYDNMPYEY